MVLPSLSVEKLYDYVTSDPEAHDLFTRAGKRVPGGTRKRGTVSPPSELRIPGNPNLLSPGHYVLFLVNDRGAVSEAGLQVDSVPVEPALQRRLAPCHRPVVVPGKERLEDG